MPDALDALADRIRTAAKAKQRILIVSQQEARLRELLEDRDVYPAAGLLTWSHTALTPGLIVLGSQPVAQGFRLPSAELDVYGDTDIFGGLRQRVRRGVVPRAVRHLEARVRAGRPHCAPSTTASAVSSGCD